MSSTNRCPNCGQEVRANANFCPKCKFSLKGTNPGEQNGEPATNAIPARPAPVVSAPGAIRQLDRYRVVGNWAGESNIWHVTHDSNHYLALKESAPMPARLLATLQALPPNPNLAHVCDQVQDDGPHSYLIVDQVPERLLSGMQVPIAQQHADGLFAQLQRIMYYMHETLNLTITPDPLVIFKGGALKRFLKAFSVTPQYLILFDYTIWEPMPDQLHRIRVQHDLGLILEALSWFYTGKYPGLFEKAVQASKRLFGIFQSRFGTKQDVNFDFQELGEAMTKTVPLIQPGQTIPLPRTVQGAPTQKLDLQLTPYALTDNGKTRDHNEDNQYAKLFESGGLFIVADGMGGHAAGEVASELAIKELSSQAEAEWANLRMAAPDQVRTQLGQWIRQANARIHAAAQVQHNDMGTTLTAALVLNRQVYVANVGDSRTYLIRNGELYQLTHDHSLVASLVQAGLLQPEEVYDHPQRNQIFRSLGYQSQVTVDVFDPVPLGHEDRLLLCSDGLWEMVRTPELKEILAHNPTPEAACRELVAAANHNGGEDNITVVLVRVTF